MNRKELFEHSDLHGTVSYNDHVLAYHGTIRGHRCWRMQPSGDEIIDRATNHAISGNPDDITPGELRRVICDTLEDE